MGARVSLRKRTSAQPSSASHGNTPGRTDSASELGVATGPRVRSHRQEARAKCRPARLRAPRKQGPQACIASSEKTKADISPPLSHLSQRGESQLVRGLAPIGDGIGRVYTAESRVSQIDVVMDYR